MTHQIKDFKVGTKFKIVEPFAHVYGKRIFTVAEQTETYVTASAINYKGEPDGIEWVFNQTNLDFYRDSIVLIGSE